MTPPASPAGAPSLQAEVALAIALARDAGRIQLAHLGRLTRVEAKGRRDIVTEVDRACEALIIDGLRQAFPGDAVLAEESGPHPGAGGMAATGDAAGRTWVIDPLDGTINYANALPAFCVSIGLVTGGQPVLGVVLDPVRGDLYEAVAGRGARLNGATVTCPPRATLAECLATIVLPQRGWSRRARAIGRATRANRIMGSSALALAYVADGRFDVYVQAGGLSAWDVAAAGVIAAEAGATLSDLAGGPWFDLARRTGRVAVVAALEPHHAALLRLLGA